MKKQILILLILSLSVVLAGCSGHAEEEETLEPISAEAWPTPVAANPAPSPTPFPKISLDDLGSTTSGPVVASANLETAGLVVDGVEPVEETEAAKTDIAQPVKEAVVAETNRPSVSVASSGSLSLNSLAAVTNGEITVSAVNVRQGPSTDYKKLGVFMGGQVVDVLATNPKQDWVLLQNPNLTGWISTDYIDLFASQNKLPAVLSSTPDKQFPSDTVAPIFLAAGSSVAVSGNQSASSPKPIKAVPVSYQPAAATTAVAGHTVPSLGPVAVTTISVPKTDVRPGPGTQFAPVGDLSDPVEQLVILGVDPARQWALVDPEHGHSRVGWVAVSDTKIAEANLADAPQIYTGWTNSNALTLRTGPGIFHNEVGKLPINNIVRVVGLNTGRSWALIQPVFGGSEGWTQIKYLTLSDKVSNLPIAPAPPPVEAPKPIDPAVSEASAKQGMLALQLSSGGEIVTLNADGSALKTTTHGIDPALSPDGSRLAFTRWEGGEAGNGTLWVKDLTTGNEESVLGFIKQPKGAEWSPDGSQIVINFQHEGRLTEKPVKVQYSPGRASKIPWNAGDIGVEVEPVIKDGQMVGAVPYLTYNLPPDPHWGLRVVNVADGSFEDMDGGIYAFRPAWDPAQDWRLVSDGGQGLLEVDVNRKEHQVKLTENYGDGSPVFSPDGQYIALATGKPGGSDGYNIYRLNRNGGGRVQLTQTPLWEAVTPDGEGKQWNNVAPAWSPDSSQVAFLTDRSGRWEVWVMNADGSNERPVFSDEVNSQLNITYNFVDERVISWQ